MSGDQETSATLDLSERLRLLMIFHKLTVTELAKHAGVSKSAMEKYLAGPSSPRATAIAAICSNLSVNAEWLIFGHADDDIRRIRDIGTHEVIRLLNDIKKQGDLQDSFAHTEFESKAWQSFVVDVGTTRAEELADLIADNRKREIKRTAEGERISQAGPFPLTLLSDLDFRRGQDKK